jgi:DNA ligase (NAD+)
MTAYFTLPTLCPACASTLVREGEYLVCRGEDCPAQVVGGISRWVKKVGVLGIGDSVIEALVDAGKVSDAADLYTMDPNDIASVLVGGSRLGQSAHSIVAELKSKAEMPLHVLVGSTGIPLCSRSVCKTIVEAGFDTLDKMRVATRADIERIPGLGPTKADAPPRARCTRRRSTSTQRCPRACTATSRLATGWRWPSTATCGA